MVAALMTLSGNPWGRATLNLYSLLTIHHSPAFSVNADAVNAVPLLCVGEDDRVTLAQAVEDFDGADGGAAQADRDADSRVPVGFELKERDVGLRAAARRGATDVEDVVEPRQLNRPVHAQIDARARRQLAFELHVDGERAVVRRRVEALDAPLDDAAVAAARVNARLLADGHVLDLRLRNLERGLEARRGCDARDVRARRDLLADRDRHLLKHAVRSGAHLQGGDVLLVEPQLRAQLLDARLLRGDLRVRRLLGRPHALLLDLQTVGELLHFHARDAQREQGNESFLAELLVGVELNLGLVVLILDLRGRGLLRHAVAVVARAQVVEVGLG